MAMKVPLFRIQSTRADMEAAKAVLKRGTEWAEGPEIEAFEKELADYLKVPDVVVFNSGTSALHAAMLTYGIGPGDEVIVPSFTFIATANAPLFVGAKPVFADIEGCTYGLDPESVKEKITDKTKAIIPIHYAGGPCRIRELRTFAADHDLLLIEDVAEAFGARSGVRRVGSYGDAAILSFCQNKIITTGEGGAVVTQDEGAAINLRLLRSHGWTPPNTMGVPQDHVILGYNWRMPSICAAIGLSQLARVGDLIKKRRTLANRYYDALRGKFSELMAPEPPLSSYHVYQMFPIFTRDRDELMKFLADRGIATKVYFPPVHLTTFYRGRVMDTSILPITERIAREVLCLPIYPGMTRKEQDYVILNILEFYGRTTP